jgi:hypothetical protein
MMADRENRSNWSHPELHHWSQSEWRKFVTPDDQPGLNYWKPGTELPKLHLTNHLKKPHIRLLQNIAHRFLLPTLDSRRPTWPADAYPQRIPAEIVARLQLELNEMPT